MLPVGYVVPAYSRHAAVLMVVCVGDTSGLCNRKCLHSCYTVTLSRSVSDVDRVLCMFSNSALFRRWLNSCVFIHCVYLASYR